MRSQPVDYLFFGAHPDDVEIACGGSIARFVSEGRKVGIIDLTGGEMGTRGTPAQRLDESLAAARILGAIFRERMNFGDGNLRTGRDEELEVIDRIRRVRPAVVFAPYPDDRHPDHTRTGKLVTESAFYAGLAKIETNYPAHRPQIVAYYIQNYGFDPTFVVDVSATFAQKVKALRAYKSQFHNPRSREPMTMIAKKSFLQLIEGRARHFGGLIGAEFGEGFITKQPPRIDDVAAAYRGREVS